MTLRKTSIRLFSIFCIFISLNYFLKATTLPQLYEMTETTKNIPETDPQLFSWLNDLKNPINLLSINPNQIDNKLSQLAIQDPISIKFLKLRYLNMMNLLTEDILKEFLETAKVQITLYENSKNVSPILSYFLKELFSANIINEEDKKFIYKSMLKIKDKSCPSKEAILQEIEDAFTSIDDYKYYADLLTYTSQFRSKNFKDKIYSTFLSRLPADKQNEYNKLLYELLKDNPNILEDNLWILEQDKEHPIIIQKQKMLNDPIYKAFNKAIEESNLGHCRTAKIIFETTAKKFPNKEFDLALKTLSTIEKCMRKKGLQNKLQFWSNFQKVLEDNYGFKGKFISLKNQALNLWKEDNFEESKKIFTILLEEAQQNNHEYAIEYSLYILARINENEGRINEAIDYFTKFVHLYKKSENRIVALIYLIILNAQLSKIKTAIYYAEELLASQANLNINKISLSVMSFVLFWLGRLHYSIGNVEIAKHFLMRNATEFYSTYYGFLSHFYLEKILQKKFELQPHTAVSFDKEKMLTSLSSIDQNIVQRIELLLKFGFTDEAICEINEFASNEDNETKLFLKSIFQYIVQDWFNSVKNYNALNRTYRHSLPKGSEKILFPQNYENLIKKYSAALGLDPYLIAAIIRQESVFNPKARSAVGAKGLMQLMPNTAKVEIQSLKQQQILKSAKKKRSQKLNLKEILYDAEINIILGTKHFKRLYNKYQNLVYALAAYNANPKIVDKWINNLKTKDFLIFIERIPYSETKNYVKLILRNYFYYKKWYAGYNASLNQFKFLTQNFKLKSIKAEVPIAPQP